MKITEIQSADNLIKIVRASDYEKCSSLEIIKVFDEDVAQVTAPGATVLYACVQGGFDVPRYLYARKDGIRSEDDGKVLPSISYIFKDKGLKRSKHSSQLKNVLLKGQFLKEGYRFSLRSLLTFIE